jgi:hypothetical protein
MHKEEKILVDCGNTGLKLEETCNSVSEEEKATE